MVNNEKHDHKLFNIAFWYMQMLTWTLLEAFPFYNYLHLSSESYKGTFFKCLYDKRDYGSVFVCKCVYYVLCTWIYTSCVYVHIYTYIWSTALKTRHLSESLSRLSFETGSCPKPGLTTWLHCLGNKSQWYTCHVFTTPCIMVIDSYNHDKLYYMGPGDLNSGPYTWIVGSLPTESSPQSKILFLKEKMHIGTYVLLGSRMCKKISIAIGTT